MARGNIGSFGDVPFEVVEFDLSGSAPRFIQRILVSKYDFPRTLEKAELTMS